MKVVKEKAGVAGLSTYIKHYIRTNTELFKGWFRIISKVAIHEIVGTHVMFIYLV
jgi:hypothetical protein